MKTAQLWWNGDGGWQATEGDPSVAPQLVLVFGSRGLLERGEAMPELRRTFPDAALFGCSTAGEIRGTRVDDLTVVATAVEFASTRVRMAVAPCAGSDSASVGARLANALSAGDLAHVLVLSDGLAVNGSELVSGIVGALDPRVTVTGGLAGDGADFRETVVVHGDCVRSGVVAAVGFYGSALSVGFGSLGGWDPFGPERMVTKSKGNVLHELDGKSALATYKRYLGEHAAGLPATGLLFPLSLRVDGEHEPVVRTVLAVDDEHETMTFAGDLPQGGIVRLMKANFDRLVDGAAGAAGTSYEAIGGHTPELALLISCVGRKLVLKQRVEEEVEAVSHVLGSAARLTGFYSYGEISPFTPSARCELHNQTMTITCFSEAA